MAAADQLIDRHVLVVGAGTRRTDDPDAPLGNGRAIALEAARAGAMVACADIDPQAAADTVALIARSPSARELVMHPLALATAGVVLGHATNFQLHLTQAIAIGPDSPAQPVHRDQWAFDFFPFPAGYEVQCNTIWALTDFTEENGATRVVPGSHRQADGLRFELDDTEAATMTRGSVLFYTGSVYHGGGPNRSAETRIGLNITYNLAWLRQEENQYLAVPHDLAATLPIDLLRLMGYDRGAYALGYIDDLRDPIEAIRPDLADSTAVGFGVTDGLAERAAGLSG